MVNFKWDQKRALEVATEDGEARGKRNAMKEVTLKLLKRGIPLGIITDSTLGAAPPSPYPLSQAAETASSKHKCPLCGHCAPVLAKKPAL